MDTERLLVGGFLICFSLIHQVFSSLEDATSEVGLGANFDGVLAAFGDFNSDKKADLFLISSKTKDHSKVEIYLWDTGDDEFKKTTKATIRLEKSRISNIIPADFNGDGHLDVLVAFNNQSVSKTDTFIKVFFGLKNQFESEHVNMQDVLKDQPAIIDFDGDLLPDLLGEKKSDSKRYWWKYRPKTKKFESHVINSTGNLLPLTKPHSSAFLDLNGDYTPDIFIPTSNKKSSLITFEIWTNQEGKFNSPTTTVYPAKNEGKEQTIGQSTFADIDSDGIADHLLPVCIGKKCEKSEIQVYSKDKEKGWISVLMSEKSEGFKWRFVHDPEQETPFMTIRIGDYDLDGFPDAVVIVELQLDGEQEYKRRVVLLENVGCSGSSMGCYHGRKLNIVSGNHVLSTINNPLVVGFFDLYDNGILDLMVVTSNESSGTYQIRAIKNKVYSDTCFLKVIVLGGSCFSSCRSGVTMIVLVKGTAAVKAGTPGLKMPYGVNQAGPFVKYVTTGPDGDTKKASATQLSQAAYFALQPPYTVFGLGRTPNFVEKLIIGLPRSTNSTGRKHTWTSIIPNSQVIIIPYPPDEPDEWKSKLLVTPSRLVMLTGGALLATCVFIGAIIGLLHWKEKKEDLKEKQEAAHKFHFDAM